MNSRLKQELLTAIEACEAKKAEDLTILQMDQAAGAFTDYFILCTGNSDRQNQTIADEIELQIKRQIGTYAHQVEGYHEGEWILVDYTDFIVHIFTAERRNFYGLERLWKSARALSPAELRSAPEDKPAIPEAAPVPSKKAAKKARPAKALSTRTAAKVGAKKPVAKPAKSAPAKQKTAAKKKTARKPG